MSDKRQKTNSLIKHKAKKKTKTFYGDKVEIEGENSKNGERDIDDVDSVCSSESLQSSDEASKSEEESKD